jgi:cytochrome c556
LSIEDSTVRTLQYTIAAILVGTVVSALAATAEISQAIKSRKANYKEIGGAFKTLNDEIRTGAPSIDTIQPIARDLLKRGAMQMNFFPAGSGPESDEKTRAKAEVWSEQQDFRRIHDEFILSAQKLNQAIDAGDLAAISSAQKSLGASCKSCHERYREPE